MRYPCRSRGCFGLTHVLCTRPCDPGPGSQRSANCLHSASGGGGWRGGEGGGQRNPVQIFSERELLKTHPVAWPSTERAGRPWAGAPPGAPSPAPTPPAGARPADAVVEIDRMVNNGGCVGIA